MMAQAYEIHTPSICSWSGSKLAFNVVLLEANGKRISATCTWLGLSLFVCLKWPQSNKKSFAIAEILAELLFYFPAAYLLSFKKWENGGLIRMSTTPNDCFILFCGKAVPDIILSVWFSNVKSTKIHLTVKERNPPCDRIRQRALGRQDQVYYGHSCYENSWTSQGQFGPGERGWNCKSQTQ